VRLNLKQWSYDGVKTSSPIVLYNMLTAHSGPLFSGYLRVLTSLHGRPPSPGLLRVLACLAGPLAWSEFREAS
jgi:hypothetical protein